LVSLLEHIIAELSRFIIATISKFGYAGILLTMAIESACVPLPSEIIMPFSGYLTSTGRFSMLGVTLAPATAEAVADLLTSGHPPDVLQPFSPLRWRRA